MAWQLHITFKAGLCDAGEKDTSTPGEPRHIKPLPTPGYIYLFTEDDLLHFCWRPRSSPLSEPELDLIMFAGDAAFKPYKQHGSKYDKTRTNGSADTQSPTNGRLFVLSFSSSSDRHFFWLQSKSQSPENDPSWHSPRDLKIAEIVNKLLAGEEVDARQEISSVPTNGSGPSGGDDDTAMDDDDGAPHSPSHHRAASGGAGADATGGDIREEGEESREGGADGGRAATSGSFANPETQAAVTKFLQSLGGDGRPRGTSKDFTTLPDLLPTTTTLPVLANASHQLLDRLLSHVPPSLILLAAGTPADDAAEPDSETVQAISMSLEADQKREILTKVLRSPQFSQGLTSLTMALRDGGLPTISRALKVPVQNDGFISNTGTVPMGDGDAVQAFLEGLKKQEEEKEDEGGQDEKMDTE